MRALDFDVHKAEVKQLMEEHTKDGNTNEVDLEEFMDILMLKYKERDPDEELAKAFKFFDEDGTGKITLKNLRKIARDLGEHIPDEELGAMIEEFDDDQDGGINEAEFQKIMRGDDFDDY
ncbi:hypothetical protein KP509_18G084700 [Ceratopteris richardii]|nr:hypothetical protein KP509_18G084700 [Ceratopteris richardii]